MLLVTVIMFQSNTEIQQDSMLSYYDFTVQRVVREQDGRKDSANQLTFINSIVGPMLGTQKWTTVATHTIMAMINKTDNN